MSSIRPELIRPLPISAGSGLVIFGGKFFICADDEVSLLVTDLKGNDSYIRLWKKELPENPEKRKKKKPDLESLFLDEHFLYALPSFSRKNRTEGARIELDKLGNVVDKKKIDLTQLYKSLNDIPDLNIEGAIKKDDKLILFQRGNGEKGENGLVILKDLESKKFDFIPLELPKVNDVQVSITDAALHKGEIHFLAVAENSSSTYLDGKVSGAFIGKLSHHKVSSLTPIDFQGKPEGLAFDGDVMYFVTDDDSRDIPSRLFRYGS
ncbi:MAG: DUF6929 family protein [Bacteriovoracaceae bacterium]